MVPSNLMSLSFTKLLLTDGTDLVPKPNRIQKSVDLAGLGEQTRLGYWKSDRIQRSADLTGLDIGPHLDTETKQDSNANIAGLGDLKYYTEAKKGATITKQENG